MLTTERYKVALVTFLILIILSSVTSVVFSQSGTYRGFKVHAGDTARYDIIKATTLNRNYSSLSSGSLNYPGYTFNLTQGDSITIKVDKIEYIGGYVVLSDITVVMPHNTTHVQMVSSSLFIHTGFESFADVQSYIRQQNQLALNSNSNRNLTLNGDIITDSYMYSNPPEIGLSILSYNWKTGWVQYSLNKVTFSNGTIYNDIIFQRFPIQQVVSTPVPDATILFEIGFLFIVVAMVIMLVWGYVSYSKSTASSDDSQSFIHYLKNRFTYRKKGIQIRSITETDKALRTIESIIEENKDTSE